MKPLKSVKQERHPAPRSREKVSEPLETLPSIEGSSGEPEVETISEEEQGLMAAEPVSSPHPVSVSQSVPQDPLTKQIEFVLEQDLTDLYLGMPLETQQVFKQKGEVVLSHIRTLMEQTKINAKKIFHLIREWLAMIPGVNRFFLEQEAKIKTDQILLLAEQEKHSDV